MKPPILQTQRLRLDAFTLADAEAMFSYCGDPDTTRLMAWPTHKSVEDSRATLKMFLDGYAAGNDMPIAIRDKATGQLLGSSGLHGLGASWVSIGWILSPQARGRGIAFEGVSALIEWGSRALPGSARLAANIHPDNQASIKLARRLGFSEGARVQGNLPNLSPEPSPEIRFTLEPRACRP